jgi:hypothetical protein
MESFLARIVDAVFRVAVAIDQQLREAQEEQVGRPRSSWRGRP